ncbi:MAG: condensation domain-containing protein [Actinomycetota bacterium]|nr:condensation domain-containing protein [Actinomycetota bacterium]
MSDTAILSAVTEVLGLTAPAEPSDNFFDLGGSSLAAIQLALRLERELGVAVGPRAVLSADTLAELIAGLAGSVGEITDPESTKSEPSAASRQRASMAQQWALDSARAEPDAPPLQFQVGYLLRGPLDVERFQLALTAVCQHHPELLVAFERAGDHDRAVPVPAELPLVHHAWYLDKNYLDESLTAQAAGARAVALLTGAARVPFNRESGLRLRALVVSCATDRHYLMLSLDHLTADGWSLNVLVEDLSTAYAQLLDGQDVLLPPAGSYRDYSHRQWQGSSERRAVLGDYWRSQLPADYADFSLTLPGYRGPGPLRDPRTIELPASERVADALAAAGASSRQSAFTLTAAALCVLIARWTGRSQVRLLTSCANRLGDPGGRTVGWFANGVFPTFELDPDVAFEGFAAEVADRLANAMEHGDLPASYVRREVWPDAPAGYRKDTGIYLACNDAWGESLSLPGCSVEAVELPDAADAPGLQLYLFREATGWVLRVLWHASEYDPDTARALGEQLLELLERAEELLPATLRELCSATAAAIR